MFGVSFARSCAAGRGLLLRWRSGALVSVLHLVQRGRIGSGVNCARKTRGTRGTKRAVGSDGTNGAHEISALPAKLTGYVFILAIAASGGIGAVLPVLLRGGVGLRYIIGIGDSGVPLLFLAIFFVGKFKIVFMRIHVLIHKKPLSESKTRM